MKVYAMANPMWLADTFVFSYGERYDGFVKINHKNKIEEIGIDIAKRIHTAIPLSELVSCDNVRLATKLEASIYRRIDKEFFADLYNKERRTINANIK